MTLYKSLEAYWQQYLPTGKRSSRALVGVLFSEAFAAISGAFVARVLITVTQILIVRQLGTMLYGQYATITTTLGLLASLLGLGLDTWLLQEGGRNPASLARNIWQVLLVKAVGAVVVLALLGIAWTNQVVLSAAFGVGVVSIIFDSFAQTGYSALRATRRNVQIAVFQTLAPLSLLLMLWVMRNTTASVLALLSIQSVCSIVITLILMVKVWRLFPLDRRHPGSALFVIRSAWLFVAADVLSNIYTQGGVAILGMTADPTDVAIFRTAIHTISFMFLAPNLLFFVGLPLLNAPDISLQSYHGLVRAMGLSALAYGLAVLAGLWVAGGTLIRVLFGADYDAALPLVLVMSVVPLVKSGSFVSVAVLLSCNRQRWRVMLQAIAVLISIGGGLLVIPRYGSYGATVLYVVIECVLFALYASGARLAVRRTRA